MQKRLTFSFVFLLPLLVCFSCDDVDKLMKKFKRLENPYDASSYQDVPGDRLTSHLAKTIQDRQENLESILQTMQIAEEEEGKLNLLKLGLVNEEDVDRPVEANEDTAQLLAKLQEKKVFMDARDFQGDDNSFFTKSPPGLAQNTMQFANDTVNWTASHDSFIVSVASKIPVRDQGRRGTCSSFAGIGQVEGALLKKYSTLESIDLSEQRFYYMSKPEHWETGGNAQAGGSDAGTGFSKSNGYTFGGHSFPPGSPSDYNIPLEAECPYNPQLGANDLQVPQASGCGTGVAKVTNFAAWVYQWQDRPMSAQEIYDFLKDRDYPVVVATRLSRNWEYNDGLITMAAAGGAPGATSHASGHAYLVVGARKLDSTKFPNEGGMCFIIKNSWGTGWGVNGYSCMTLAWFNAWRYPDGFPAVLDVELDPDKYQEAKDYINSRPSELIEPDDATRSDRDGKASQGRSRRGRASFFTEPTHSYALLSDDMEYGSLLTENEEYQKILYKISGETIHIRGIKGDNKTVTHGIDLTYRNGAIYYQEQSYDELQVGSLDNEAQQVTLCSGDFLSRCYLRYIEESNELIIGLSKEEALRQKSEGPYDWKGVDLAGYGVDLSLPQGAGNMIDLRMKTAGKESDPLRFLIKPLSGDILYSGKRVGNYQNFSLCNESYRSVCRVVLSGNKLNINFKAAEPSED